MCNPLYRELVVLEKYRWTIGQENRSLNFPESTPIEKHPTFVRSIIYTNLRQKFSHCNCAFCSNSILLVTSVTFARKPTKMNVSQYCQLLSVSDWLESPKILQLNDKIMKKIASQTVWKSTLWVAAFSKKFFLQRLANY